MWLEEASLKSKIVIADAIGDDVRVDVPMLKDKDICALINFYDGILCNSREMIGIVDRLCPEHPPIYEAYRGVDFSKFNNEVQPKTPFKDKQFPTFLYLGGFPGLSFNYERDVKGGIYLLEAWKKYEMIQKKGRLIVGGPNSNNKLVQNWRKSLFYPERVEIIGQLDPDEVPEYITGADAVVIPSLSEGLPNLANESQACGKPVLATDVGGTKESVEHNVTGIMFESMSVQALLQVLIKFTNNGEEAAIKLGENGIKRIREIFPWQRYRDSALKSYREAFLKKGIKIDF
jgi:glycosyltransferase involved in cell wall biosynthesis